MIPRSSLAAGLLLALAVTPAAGAAPKEPGSATAKHEPEPRRVLVRVKELHVGDGRMLAPGELLLEAGKVKAFGTKVDAPPDIETWDEASAILTPWLVDPDVRVPLAGNEAGRPESVLLSAADARSPWDPWLEPLRQGGAIAVALVPSGGAGFLGRTTVVGTEGPGAGGEPVLEQFAQLAFALPSSGSSASAAAARQSLVAALEDADRYGRERDEEKKEADAGKDEARPRREDLGERHQLAKDDDSSRSDTSEILLAVARKKLPLRIIADRAADVAGVLDLARQRGLAVTIVGCRECGRIAELVGQSQASVVVEPLRESAREIGGAPSDPELAASLARADARLAVSAGGPWPSGPAWLRVAAADLAGRGVPREKAIAAMTGEAARACGAPQGTLDVGAPARFLIWDGDPLDPASRIGRRIEPKDVGATQARAAPATEPDAGRDAGKHGAAREEKN